LKALVRRNALKLGHDRFPFRVGTARIRRWAGFLDEPESSKQSRLRTWNVLQIIRLVLSETEKRCDSATSQSSRMKWGGTDRIREELAGYV